MKKITLLIYHNSKDKFLQNLQDMGAVHLETNSSINNEKIESLKENIGRLKKAENILSAAAEEYEKKTSQEKFDGSLDELLGHIEMQKNKIDELYSRVETIDKEIQSISQWGVFDPENIHRLTELGLKIKFYSLLKSKFDRLDKETLRLEVINQVKSIIYFVIIYDKDEEPAEINAVEEKFPLKNITVLQKEKEDILLEIENEKSGLSRHTGYIKNVREESVKLENELSYNISEASLREEVEGKVLIITGWIPKHLLKKVNDFLMNEDSAFIIEDPQPGDNVPIYLVNNPLVRLFEPIMKIFSLPSYIEIDTTVFLAPFFALFFGLCQADVGYGLFLLAATTLTSIFLFRKKNLRRFAFLGVVLSIMVIVGGTMLNGFFGFKFTDILIDKYNILPEYFRDFTILNNQNDAMFFALFLGVIQVLVGFLMRTYIQIKSNGFRGGLQPIGNFLLLFGVTTAAVAGVLGKGFKIGPIPVGEFFFLFPEPVLTGAITAGLGTLLILLFNNIDKKIYLRPLLGLWEMYGNITGIPGDILSYLRLFALGLSSGLLGGAINQIAFMARGDGSSIIGIFFMVLIMILGHGINLCLSLIGSFVHPLRLTFVEFYKNVGFTGGGIEYSPFSNKKK